MRFTLAGPLPPQRLFHRQHFDPDPAIAGGCCGAPCGGGMRCRRCPHRFSNGVPRPSQAMPQPGADDTGGADVAASTVASRPGLGRHSGGAPCLTFIRQSVWLRTRGAVRSALSDVPNMKCAGFFLAPLTVALPAGGQTPITSSDSQSTVVDRGPFWRTWAQTTRPDQPGDRRHHRTDRRPIHGTRLLHALLVQRPMAALPGAHRTHAQRSRGRAGPASGLVPPNVNTPGAIT